MRKIGLKYCVVFAAMLFAACGDDGGTSASNDTSSSASNRWDSIADLLSSSDTQDSDDDFSSSSLDLEIDDEELSSSSSKNNVIYKDESVYNPSRKTVTDLRDNAVYGVVVIGSQIWMDENLGFEVEGSKCPGVEENECYYGRIYRRLAALGIKDDIFESEDEYDEHKKLVLPDTVRGICPKGWHLPSIDEWETLFEFVGGTVTNEDQYGRDWLVAGKSLKTKSGWKPFEICEEEDEEEEGDEEKNCVTMDGNGTDEYGFSVRPAGEGNQTGYQAFLWSSTIRENSNHLMIVGFENKYDEASIMDDWWIEWNSIRCLKD